MTALAIYPSSVLPWQRIQSGRVLLPRHAGLPLDRANNSAAYLGVATQM